MHLINIFVPRNKFLLVLLFFITIPEVSGQDCKPPPAPVIGPIVQPSCDVATGTVSLSGLPNREWILTRLPDGFEITGAGRTFVVPGLEPGTYTFTVTLTDDDDVCPSNPSSEVVINEQPPTPSAPEHIVDCTLGSGSAVITVTSPLGGDLEYRLNNGTYQSSPTFSGVANGNYTITVRNSAECTATGTPFSVDCPCVNGPTINLSSTTGTTCVSNPITVSGNTFGGNATSVSITENGSGSVSPSTAEATPFSFTYTPSPNDAGRTVNITVTTNNPLGSPCQAATAIYALAVTAGPPAPVHTVDCSLGFNFAVITVSSPVGSELSYRLDNGTFQDSPVFTEVVNGNHTLTVRNSSGCLTTGTSFLVNCPCINGPVLALSSQGGTTCGITPVTVSGNTFGGNATNVSITANGSGSVNPSQTTSSPFAFTYTPSASDAGIIVTITVRTNNPLGSPCEEAVATYRLEVNAIPVAPSVGSITQPSCTQSTGSVALSNLPATGTWTLRRSPGGTEITGTGRTYSVTGLVQGTYTFTVTNDDLCTSPSSASVVINAPPVLPSAPVTGTVTHPTCSLSTGSVELSGLPGTGAWTVISSPGEMRTTGSGATARISGLTGGTYTFSVVNSAGCASLSSSNVVINPQPETPVAPVPGNITQPGCLTSTGSVVLNNLPSTGTWTLTRFPGTVTTSGSGASTTISGLAAGSYNYTVRNQAGCTSAPSANINITAQPPTPEPPAIGTITAPTCLVLTGSVNLSGLPSAGSWTLTRQPGGSVLSGSGSSVTVSELQPGTYTYTVASSAGCISAATGNIVIPQIPDPPLLRITDPAPACAPATINLRIASITTGSTANLEFSYFRDASATIPVSSPESVGTGTYYIKGTTSSLCSDIKPVNVKVLPRPVAMVDQETSDQVLEYIFSSVIRANTPLPDETGAWSLLAGMGRIAEPANPATIITEMSVGINLFLWTVSNQACPPAYDTARIMVHDLVIPSLITPNNDNRNQFFILEGLLLQGRTELSVFNRKGERVFKNVNYDNRWDGIDDNGDPLPDDTYFYVVKSQNGRSRTGFIVIRR